MNKAELLAKYPAERTFYGPDAAAQKVQELLAQHPSVAALKTFWNDIKGTSWPETFGQSPWEFAGGIAYLVYSHPEPLRAMRDRIASMTASADGGRYSTQDLDERTLLALDALADREPGLRDAWEGASSSVKSYYVWHDDGSCDNVTQDLEEARQWEREFLDEGRDAYITDADNFVIDETVMDAPMRGPRC